MTRKILIAVATVAAIVGAFIVIYSTVKAKLDNERAAGFAAGRQVEIDAASARMKQRQTEFDAEKKKLTAERDSIKTQKQAVQVITKYLPATSGQIVEVKRDDLPAEARAALPDAAGYSCMTEQAAITLGKAVGDLQVCGAERTKLTADAGDLRSQVKATAEQRDQWEQAARGGSKWQRAKAAAKWIAIGAAIGYAGAKAK